MAVAPLFLTLEKNEAATIQFPLEDAGTTDFESTPVTFVAADTQISKDGAAFANTGSTPTHVGNGIYELALTAAELNADRIAVTVVDAATKAWTDFAIIIRTTATVADAANVIADAILSRDVDSVEATAAVPTLCSAILKAVSRIRDNAGSLETYRTNATTIHMTQPLTTDVSNQPVDELGVGV